MPGPVFLESDRVTLRPIERDDLAFLQRAMNAPDVWRPALDIDPMNREQAAEFFETVVSETDGGVHCLVCTDGDPLGVVTLSASRYGPDETARSRAAELAYWLAPEHHGQGYGSDAVSRLLRYAFEDRNLRRVSARVGSFNDASVGLLERLGFEREGRLRDAAWYRGDYHDMYWYGLLREEWRKTSDVCER
ncbi:GNAT family N-acetyltransferase [Halobiforma nitratireducens]|uniref:N-acetyltransferase GCN5 n=1 Tax=Halobiforma nitratireducens JCM 10879 TaxID=1227454 RepID=M0LTK2_9EURY|nr:GNAT family protein [Halobiforma nitratireducens]EMA35430.1 N-acetyltransferase GCN5 [Halobiforma nitratireducens JCM 10879]